MVTIHPLQVGKYFNPDKVFNVQNCTGKRQNHIWIPGSERSRNTPYSNWTEEREKKLWVKKSWSIIFYKCGCDFWRKIRVPIWECGKFPKVKHWQSVTERPQQRPLEVLIIIKPTSRCVDKLKAFIISRSPWEIMNIEEISMEKHFRHTHTQKKWKHQLQTQSFYFI